METNLPTDLSIPKFHRRIMCFDTETSGLMPKHKAGTPFPQMEEYPYIMQLSWAIYNVATQKIEEIVNEYVKIPKTAEISPESIQVHKITREISEEKGVDIIPLLNRFFTSYMKSDCIVAHNLSFDGELVRKEMWRNRELLKRTIPSVERVNMMCGVFTKKFNTAYHIDTFCTMMNTIKFCGIDFVPKQPSIQPPDGSDLQFEPSLELRRSVEKVLGESPYPKQTKKKFPRLNELYSKLFEVGLPSDLHNSIVDVLVCLRCFLKVRGVVEMSESEFQQLIEKYSR